MRNIQQVLEMWGAWAADNIESVQWYSTAAGFSRLIPSKVKSRPQCCEDDAMISSSCMAQLSIKNREMHDLLLDYYLFGKTFMQLAREHKCSDTHIGKKLQKAEGVIDGMLMMLDIKLELDRYVEKI